MRKAFKSLILSTLIALSLPLFSEIRAMEERPKHDVDSIFNHLRKFFVGEEKTKESHGNNKIGYADSDSNINTFKNSPEDLHLLIFKQIAITNYTIGDLRMVCKTWHKIIKDNQSTIKQPIDDAVYERFLSGRLIYKPNPGNDIGKVELCIRNLENPLEGTFDLSQCGDTANILSISTGYRKTKNPPPEGYAKIEIWIAPKFFIERERKATASHFQDIYDNWHDNASIGIFWNAATWDDLSWCDYFTIRHTDNADNMSMYEIWGKSTRTGKWRGYDMYGANGGAHMAWLIRRGEGFGFLEFYLSFSEIK